MSSDELTAIRAQAALLPPGRYNWSDGALFPGWHGTIGYATVDVSIYHDGSISYWDWRHLTFSTDNRLVIREP